MRVGVHLPVMDWDGSPFTLERFVRVARAAEALGLDTLSVNDHFVFRRPWLDGPTALASVLAVAPTADLMTSVSLPVVRGPVALAKSLAAIDLLSGGRLIVGVGPGSTARDHEVVGLRFEERWSRLDEAVPALRALWGGVPAPFVGRFYDTTGIELEPRPTRPAGPPIWIGSWGSDRGLHRVARLGDGWLASAYNTTPDRFAAGRRLLGELVEASGRGPGELPNALATMWMHLTDDPAERTAVLERLGGLLRRDPSELAELLAVGSAAWCAELVGRYREAGVQRLLFWPLGDEVRQLERLAGDVVPRLG